MPHRFRIKTTDIVSGEIEELEGEFADKEWDVLARYLENAFRLAECRIVETQSQLHWSLGAEKGRPLRHEVSLPPEDDIAAFLHRLRPFLLPSEPTYFYRVRNLLAKRLVLPSVRRILEQLRLRFAGEAMGFRVEVGSEGGVVVVNSEEAVRKWLNAYEYHQDADKRADLESMYRVFLALGARALFLYALMECAAAIGKMGAIIDGLAKRDGRVVTSS